VSYAGAATATSVDVHFAPAAGWQASFDYFRIKSITVNLIGTGSGVGGAAFAIAFQPSTWSGATTYNATMSHQNAKYFVFSPDSPSKTFKIPSPGRYSNGTYLDYQPVSCDGDWHAGTMNFVPAQTMTSTGVQYNILYEIEFIGPHTLNV